MTALLNPPRRLGIFVTHPIQYFAPNWRGLAAAPGLEVQVHFFSDHSVRGGIDPGFGIALKWDVPILEGYQHTFLSKNAALDRPGSVKIDDPLRLLRDGGFTHVMVHGYTHAFERQVVKAARKLGLGVVLRGEMSDVTPYTGRGMLKKLIRNAYLRWFYRQIDAFCYIGQEARQHLLRRGIPESRLFFSPYSVDTALFESQKRDFHRAQSRRQLGIADNQLVILFSGKLIPRKAPLLLAEALNLLPSADPFTLIILGDGELRQQTEAALRPILGQRLLMPGFVNQSQLGLYFTAADVFALPSHFETWGLVVNEAMQFGLPCIVSDRVGSHRDLVLPGQTGLVHRDNDAADLSRCLQQIAADPNKLREMGQAALQRITAYTTQASVSGILQAIQSIS